MKRKGVFSLRVNIEELQAIERVAQRLQRSKSDAVRLVVRIADRDLRSEDTRHRAKVENALRR